MTLIKNYTDREIFENLRKKDLGSNQKILKFLYKKNFRVISNFICRNSGNNDDAEDIFQDTIIVIYEKIKNGNLKLNCSLTTYIYSVSKNLWLKKLNKASNTVRLEENFDIETEDEAFYEPVYNRHIVFDDAIGKLNDDCRMILKLYYYDRLSMKQIMKKMKYKSEQSAKNKKYKCLKCLINEIRKNKNFERILKELNE